MAPPSTPPSVRGRGRPPVNPDEVRGLPGLKAALAVRGQTQSDLARVLGCDQAPINAYANGKRDPGASTVRRIAATLGVTADELLAVPPVTT